MFSGFFIPGKYYRVFPGKKDKNMDFNYNQVITTTEYQLNASGTPIAATSTATYVYFDLLYLIGKYLIGFFIIYLLVKRSRLCRNQ